MARIPYRRTNPPLSKSLVLMNGMGTPVAQDELWSLFERKTQFDQVRPQIRHRLAEKHL